MITVKEVSCKKEFKSFITFANKMYKNVPPFCPTLNQDEAQNFNPKKNPAFAHCDVHLFLAYQEKAIVGRIATIINKKYNENHGTKKIRFTRFDCIEDFNVAKALFEKAFEVAKEAGMEEIVGPLGFCDLDREGMLIDGFEEDNLFITIYNHPYYKDYLERLGFSKDVDWVECQFFPTDEGMKRIQKIAQLVENRYGYTTKQYKNKRELKKDAYQIFEILNIAYEKLYGVVPLTEAQIDMYIKQFIMLINLDFIATAYDKSGQMIGAAIVAPSFSEAVRKSKGKLFPFGFIHFLKAIKHPKILDMYLIGVRTEYQGTGVNALLMAACYRSYQKYNIHHCETGPELETNHKVLGQWETFEPRFHRRRRCFIKKIER